MNTNTKPTLLFLGKRHDSFTETAYRMAQPHFQITSAFGEWGDPLPDRAANWEGDWILSYLSRWVVPAELLQRARVAAINFHPGSPAYPGIGCLNFALYDRAKEYGVTCHHMRPTVDTGDIIATQYFPIEPEDTVATLLERTHRNQYFLFQEILTCIVNGDPLPASAEKWTRKPYTRAEFNALSLITDDMSAEEIERRRRAIEFQHYKLRRA